MAVLNGRVALVTGAAKGMAKSIAARFVAEGATVVVSARGGVATAAADALGAALGVSLEITDPAEWARVVQAIDERFGGLDILVNSAGITEAASIDHATDENWRRHMAINLDGAFYGCRAALPLMRRTGRPGSIINISSVFAQRPVPGFIAYCTSKAGLTMFTKALALECAAAGDPIRVNSIHPGGIETEMFEKALAETGLPRDEAYAHFVAIHPMGRTGTPDEIAEACLWLASDASSFTTGLELNVDGGSAIRP